MLQVQVVILHVRRVHVAIDGENITLEVTSGLVAEDRHACLQQWISAAIRVSRQCRVESSGQNRRWANRVICGTWIVERRIREVPEKCVLGECIVKQAPTGADHSLTSTCNVP